MTISADLITDGIVVALNPFFIAFLSAASNPSSRNGAEPLLTRSTEAELMSYATTSHSKFANKTPKGSPTCPQPPTTATFIFK